MILDALMAVAHGFLSGALALLPLGNPEDYAGIGDAFGLAMEANAVVPIGEAVACAATVLVFNAARLALWIPGYIIKHIPGIG